MINSVHLLGRLGGDPELKAIPGGSVCNFALATSEKYKKDDVFVEKTEWHKIVAFGKLAEICAKHIFKGSQVWIEGKIQTRTWDDKDGVKRYMTEIVASKVLFLDTKKASDESGEIPY